MSRKETYITYFLGIVLGSVLGFVLSSCAGGSKSYKPRPRKETAKLYVPCHESWTPNPEGKFCNRTCTKRKGKKCKSWTVIVKDMNAPSDWKFFKDGGFGCMDLDQVL